ncbi:cyclic nucleotide-binding domain-containing protein [Streptomyces sp. APSN-46.1]|uniref:family 2B encapsulin nanocompartment shell protein n=1 Tax=Streptomyces sp. APSN-46.1 TaxID=2929049 RepID=UPI001FB23B22|nr:family 2B encapsulin nanocompartment shell protein [Streptomyces sp. APSN-46.1]MCJ1676979.1 cyclic nucleotide-binding domain-containing protein [Streptomyces sp. APSN-46.1]
MTTPESTAPPTEAAADARQRALSTAAARNLATTTKSAPQMQGISSRWLLRMLPWVNVTAGTYRVNRRLSHAVGRGRVSFVQAGADDVKILAPTLAELPTLKGFQEERVLTDLAARFVPRQLRAGDTLVEAGTPVEEVFVIAHGRFEKRAPGKYGAMDLLGVAADGDQLGDDALGAPGPIWGYSVVATTAATVMVLRWRAFQEVLDRSAGLRAHLERYVENGRLPVNRRGEADIELSSGHEGEPVLPTTFVDYDLTPREYELSLAQTILQVHTRVADLYNDPMNQFEQQLRLTVEAMRERQESELLNNREFGLLHNAAYEQRISTWSGPPTPDDMDDLLSMRRGTRFFLAHPRTIAAFFRECNKRGLALDTTQAEGRTVPAWRGVPVLPCGKIPITGGHTSSILAMRTGEDSEGVIGLTQTGIPEEYEPGLNVRYMGIDQKSIMSYLVSAYYSTAILVPDAIGILENVNIAAARS